MTDALVNLQFPSPHVAILSLQREEKRNALNCKILEEIHQLITPLLSRSDLKALILTSRGETFCSGLDLHEAATDPSCGGKTAELLAGLYELLATAPFVTITAAQGVAYGGGGGLLLASDLVVAANDLVIAFPEVLRGLIPGQVAALMRRKITGAAARSLLLTGRPCSASMGRELGIITYVVAKDELAATALTLAHDIARAAPKALAATKALLTHDAQHLHDDLVDGVSLYKKALSDGEATEGLLSFLEKRPPVWH